MSKMSISRVQMRRPFGEAVEVARFTGRRPGVLGRWDGGASFTINAPGGIGYKFVRLFQGLGSSLSIALDRGNVGTTGDTPIWLEYENDGRLIIVGLRYEGS